MSKSLIANVVILLVVTVLSLIVFSIPADPKVQTIERYLEAVCKRDIQQINTMLPPSFRDVSHDQLLDRLNTLYDEQDLFRVSCTPLILEHEIRTRPIPFQLSEMIDETNVFPYNFDGGFHPAVYDLLVRQDDIWYVLPSFIEFDELLQLAYQLDDVIELDTVFFNRSEPNKLTIERHIAMELDESLYVGIVANLDWFDIQTIDSDIVVAAHRYEALRFSPSSEISDYLGTTQADTFVNPTADQQIVWWFQIPLHDIEGFTVDDMYLRISSSTQSIPHIPSLVSLEGISSVHYRSPMTVEDVVYRENDIDFLVSIQTEETPFYFNCFNFHLYLADGQFQPITCLQEIDRVQINDTYIPEDAPIVKFIVTFPRRSPLVDGVLYYVGQIDGQYASTLLWDNR